MFVSSYQYSMLFNKYFSFGNKKDQVNLVFEWRDSFSGTTIRSSSAIFDAFSCKFNFGVALARQGCFMNLEGDGIKHASKAF
jgi:hypothetical protein